MRSLRCKKETTKRGAADGDTKKAGQERIRDGVGKRIEEKMRREKGKKDKERRWRGKGKWYKSILKTNLNFKKKHISI